MSTIRGPGARGRMRGAGRGSWRSNPTWAARRGRGRARLDVTRPCCAMLLGCEDGEDGEDGGVACSL